MKARTTLAIVSTALFFCTVLHGRIITVDDDGPADFNNIQAAINDANDGDEVVVADGTYTGTGNRDINFLGKAITVRSENGPENCIINCQATGSSRHRGFYFHNGETSNSILSGLKITHGMGKKESGYYSGSAIFCDNNSSPIIRNCIITNNTDSDGLADGSIACYNNSNPLIEECKFTNNRNYWAGAIGCSYNSSPTIKKCQITNNVALIAGINCYENSNPLIVDCNFISNGGPDDSVGGLYCSESAPVIRKCNFIGNSGDWGGAIRCENSNLIIQNCFIADNYAEEAGGGVSSFESNTQIVNCTIANNIADDRYNGDGGGIQWVLGSHQITNCTFFGNFANNNGGGISIAATSDVNIINNILWENTARDDGNQIFHYSTAPNIIYSDIQGGWSGVGNVDVDPCFAGPGISDLHLFWGSPCFNAGDPNYITGPNDIDMDGEVRVMDGRIDIGADEINPNGPYIKMSPRTLSFGSVEGEPNPEPHTLSINVYPPNSVPVDWQIIEDCNWLTVEPNSGTWSGEANEVNVSVDAAGLKTGTYEYGLRATASNAISRVTQVTLTIGNPIIELSQTEFNFEAYEEGANPANQTLSISNSGVGTLNWRITEDCNWLSVEPNSGSSTLEIDDVNLMVDISGLGWGNYSCDLIISDPNADNSPQIVSVNLRVIGPIISLSEIQFDFAAQPDGDNPPDQVLTISNTGGSILNWQIIYDCNWLSVEPNSGSSTGEINDVNLSVDITGLGVGLYGCELTVIDSNAENSPQTVSVDLLVSGPVIYLSQDNFTFIFPPGGGNPSDQILNIKNSGLGVLNWTIDYDCNWLDVFPVNGSSTGDFNQVTLGVDTNGLDPNLFYFCQLVVSDPNADNNPQTIDVSLFTECFPSDHSYYDIWVSIGRPSCWCNPRQCHGDSDGQIHKEKGLVNFWVGLPDLQILVSGWKKPDTDPNFSEWICADFDHIRYMEKGIPYIYRVGGPDLQILATYWKEPNYDHPEPPADCLTSDPNSP